MKINSTALSTRCEICHQSDLFDPTTERCERCAGIALPEAKQAIKEIAFFDALHRLIYVLFIQPPFYGFQLTVVLMMLLFILSFLLPH